MGRVARVVTSFGLAWLVPAGVLAALYVAQGMPWWQGAALGWLGWLGLVGHGVSEMIWTARQAGADPLTDWSEVMAHSRDPRPDPADLIDPGPQTSPDIFAERRALEGWPAAHPLLHIVPNQRTEDDGYDPDEHDRDVLYADEDDRTGDSGRHRLT